VSDEVLDDFVVEKFVRGDFVLENSKFQSIFVEMFQVLTGTLEVELHVVLREVVYFGCQPRSFGKKANKFITDDKRVFE
jgi:hypothetical protein